MSAAGEQKTQNALTFAAAIEATEHNHRPIGRIFFFYFRLFLLLLLLLLLLLGCTWFRLFFHFFFFPLGRSTWCGRQGRSSTSNRTTGDTGHITTQQTR